MFRKKPLPVELTFIGKPECHLCDKARTVLQSVIGELPKSQQRAITVTEFSILEDDALRERYWEEIPVLLINGNVHDYWRLTPERLQPALLKALGK